MTKLTPQGNKEMLVFSMKDVESTWGKMKLRLTFTKINSERAVDLNVKSKNGKFINNNVECFKH